MASFLVRAYQYRAGEVLPADEGAFAESLPPAHAAAIRQAAAGFTGGLEDGADLVIRRDQMTSFLARVLDLLDGRGSATEPVA